MNGPDREFHPLVGKAMKALEQGRMSRREFLRLATLLGTSAASAMLMAGCNPGTVTPAQTTAKEIQRRGTLRVEWPVISLLDTTSAEFFSTNVLRQVYEQLTRIDENGFAHPHLLESLQASEDLTMWTLNLRRGVQWSNGDDFVAEDVVQNISRMLRGEDRFENTRMGSFAGFLTDEGIEVVDERTVRLNLEKPKLDVAETLFADAALIAHRDEIERNPYVPGATTTGPFTLEMFEEENRARVVRRDGYWRTGQDEQSLPYLDAIEFIDLGYQNVDETLLATKLREGAIDAGYALPATYLAMRDEPNFEIHSKTTSWADVLRFRVDREPWNDNRVRQAVKKLLDRQKILDRAYFGEGALGHDTHVSPAHPEFAPMDVPEYDPEGARELLQEAGIENLSFSIALIETIPEAVAFAETLQEDARAAGVDITLDKMSDPEYWIIWKTTPVGITNWWPRLLATQLLSLAYVADEEGNPVDWNESGWVDEEFSALLAQAELTLDLEDRRAIMADLQRIQSERGSIAIPFWKNTWLVANRAFQNIRAHPAWIMDFSETWYDPELDPFT